MPTSPPTISTPPEAPARTSPSTFPTKADAWVAWLESEAEDIGTCATDTYNNAVEAAASATAAQAAAASVDATLWVSGTTYATGDIRKSPITYFAYRRLTNGAGTTDPSADATNWARAVAAAPALIDVTGTTQAAQAWAHYVLTNVAATTVTLPASPAAGDMIWITVANSLRTNVVARNGNKIMATSEDLTVNDPYATICLRYVDATQGWRFT